MRSGSIEPRSGSRAPRVLDLGTAYYWVFFGPHWIGDCVVPTAPLDAGNRTRIHVCSSIVVIILTELQSDGWGTVMSLHYSCRNGVLWVGRSITKRLMQFLHNARILCIVGADRSSREVENRPYRPLHSHKLTGGSAKVHFRACHEGRRTRGWLEV